MPCRNRRYKNKAAMGKKFVIFMAVTALLTGCGKQNGILRIEEQGSFAVGGTALTDSLGRTFHGDHAYVFYQKPVGARQYPLVFAHGVGQFSKNMGDDAWTDARDFRTSSCGAGSHRSCLVDDPVEAMPDGVRRRRRFPPLLMKKYGSTVSGWASTPTISTACSLAATRRL